MNKTEQKQVLNEMEFALKNGHTNVEFGTESDGSQFVKGTFGYIATSDKEFYNEMKALYNEYVTVESNEEIPKPETFRQRLEKLFGERYVIKNKKIREALDNALIECTYFKPKGVRIYLFKVEGLETPYNISATQLTNGYYWIKEGHNRY